MTSDLPPLGPGGGWADLPALRDIGSLIGPGEGPLNWEVARQVAVFVATRGEPQPEPDAARADMLVEVARAGELLVAEYSGLGTGAALGQLAVVNRQGWIEGNIPGIRYLVEELADRILSAMRSRSEPRSPLDAIFEPIMPVLMGAQIGILLGYMAGKVLGQYDILLPREEGGRLYLVLPNLDDVAAEYELDERELFLWVAVHERTHQAEFAVPWMRRHFTVMVETAIRGISVDLDSIAGKIESLDPTDPEAVEGLFTDPAGLLGSMLAPADDSALARLQSTMTVLEGYAEHVMDRAATASLPNVGRMREALTRRRSERSMGERLLERLFGLEMKRRQYEQGKAFCDYVADSAGITVLNRLWDSAENLPTPDEFESPLSWMRRVAPPGSEG